MARDCHDFVARLTRREFRFGRNSALQVTTSLRPLTVQHAMFGITTCNGRFDVDSRRRSNVSNAQIAAEQSATLTIFVTYSDKVALFVEHPRPA
jgi:hypothetical protein